MSAFGGQSRQDRLGIRFYGRYWGQSGHGFLTLPDVDGSLAEAAYAFDQLHADGIVLQARPFYERLGYEVFGVLDGYPPAHLKVFLKKALT